MKTAALWVALIVTAVGELGFFLVNPLLDGDSWAPQAIYAVPFMILFYLGCVGALYLAANAPESELLPFVLPALVASLLGVAALANERFDSSVAEVHQARELKRIEPEGGYRQNPGVTPQHLVFQSWRGRGIEDILVPRSLAALSSPGRIWELRIRRGWLGYPWVESMKPVSRVTPASRRSP